MKTPKAIFQLVALFLFAVTLASCTAQARKDRALSRADKYFAAGEYEKAKIEYMNVLRIEGENSRAIQQLGLVFYEQGAAVRAIPFLQRGAQLSSNPTAIRSKLAAALFSLGDPARAREQAAIVLQSEPGHEEALILMADTARTEEDRAATEELVKTAPENVPGRHLAAATLAAKKGELPEAEKHARRAVELAPKSPTGHIALGNLLMMQKQADAAAAEIQIAADLSPLRSPARMKLAEFKMQTGKADEAKKMLEEVTAAAPDFLPAYRLRARIALAEQKWDEALAVAEKGMAREADDFDLRLFQAQAFVAKGEPKKGIEAIERFPEAFRQFPYVKYELARAHVMDRNEPAALEALEQVLAAKPDIVEAVLLKGELNLRAGQPQVVVASMTELLNRRGDIPQAKLLLAQAREAVGQFPEAEAIYRQEIARSDKNASLHLFLGRTLQQQQKLAEARTSYEKALELAPENLVILSHLVGVDLADKDLDRAVARVDAAIAKNPSAGGAHQLKGKIYLTQKDFEKAIASFQKAIELDPTLSSAYESLIAAYSATGKMDEALAQAEALLKQQPKSLQTLLLAGIMQQSRGDLPKALDLYERALSVDGDSVTALNNAAYLYLLTGSKPDLALAHARKARSLQPSDPSVADTLGWALYHQKEYQQALALIQESAKTLGENPEVQFHLGMASYMTGDTATALTALRRASQAPGKFPGKDEIAPRLSLLESLADPSKQLSSKDLEALLAKQPNDPLAQMRLGQAYEAEGDAKKAIAAYEQVLKVNPSASPAMLRLGELLVGTDPVRAFNYAKSARELVPSDDKASATAANVALRTGNFTWAYNVLNEVARRSAPNPKILYSLGQTAFAVSKQAEADETMGRLTRDFPEAPEAKSARTFLALTAFLKAPAGNPFPQSDVESRLKENPSDLAALLARGVHEAATGPAAAMNTLNTALKVAPDHAPVQMYLAEIYGSDPKRLAEAYDLAAKARRTLPDDPTATRIFGELSSKRGEHAFAIELLKASARKSPLPPTGLFYLGRSQIQEGQAEAGKKSLQQAMAAGLPAPLSTEAEKMFAATEPAAK
jgi:tetratricopeptide (TPR) repeat protein